MCVCLLQKKKTHWLPTAYDFKAREFKIMDAVDGNFVFSKAFYPLIHFQPRPTKDLPGNFEGSLILKIDLTLFS